MIHRNILFYSTEMGMTATSGTYNVVPFSSGEELDREMESPCPGPVDFQQLSVIRPIGGDRFPLAPPVIMNVRKREEWILVDVGSLDREQVKTTKSNYEQFPKSTRLHC